VVRFVRIAATARSRPRAHSHLLHELKRNVNAGTREVCLPATQSCLSSQRRTLAACPAASPYIRVALQWIALLHVLEVPGSNLGSYCIASQTLVFSVVAGGCGSAQTSTSDQRIGQSRLEMRSPNSGKL
jgi:hypothetical protein